MFGLSTNPWPESGLQVWHVWALNKPLARIRASSLACLVSQQTLGPNQGEKFSMFGLSTNPWPESGACFGSQQTLGPNQGFKFSMFGLSTNPWPESGLQV